MEIKTFDILLLFTLAITVALIIGINVIYVVDKKLSDIKINVPPCPSPNVYIKSSSGLLTKVEVDHIDRSASKMKIVENRNQSTIPHHETIPMSHIPIPVSKPRQHYDSLPNPPINVAPGYQIHSHGDNRRINNNIHDTQGIVSAPIEGFDSVGKSSGRLNDLPLVVNNGGDLEKMMLRQGYHSTGNDNPNTGNNISYPDSSDIVRYSEPGHYKNVKTNGIRRVNVSKLNQPISKLTARDGQVNNIKSGFMTASGHVVDQNIDFYIPRTYMGNDPYIRGASYADTSLEQPADIDQIGSIPVNDYDGSPQPMGSFIID